MSAALRPARRSRCSSSSWPRRFGAVCLQQLRRDVFPDLSAPVFNVIVQNAGDGRRGAGDGGRHPDGEPRSPACPTCGALRSTSQLGVARSPSSSSPTPTTTARASSSPSASAQVAQQLPPGTDAPLLSSLTGRLNEIFEFTLEAEPGAVDLMTLRDLAEFEVKNRLLAVPGVAAVERLGGYLRQFQVQLDPDAHGGARRHARRGDARRRGRQRQRRGRVRRPGRHRVDGARGRARRRRVDDLRTTVVAVRGTPCRSCSATSPTSARRRRSAAASRTASPARS